MIITLPNIPIDLNKCPNGAYVVYERRTKRKNVKQLEMKMMNPDEANNMVAHPLDSFFCCRCLTVIE